MSRNKKASCEHDLRAKVLSLEITPGTPLDEASLVREYGISRTPLREILQRLAGAGLVELEENRGAKVTSMDLATMRVFFQTAPLIYASIARQAAENRSAAQLDQLRDIQRALITATQERDAQRSGLLNHDFHALIGDMAQNPYLQAGLDRMLVDHTRLGQTFYNPQSDADAERVRKAIDQHEEMITAIEERAAASAVELTLEHWDLSRDQLEKYVRPDPLPLDLAPMKDQRHAV